MRRYSGTEQKPDLRYEIKMVAQEHYYHELMFVLRLNGAGIRGLYPPRRVQSIYLDTPHGAALGENHAGISHREKIRFRWYGPEERGVHGTLENKVKENTIGWKHLLPIDTSLDVAGVDRVQFTEVLRAHLTPEWRSRFCVFLEPVQWISYLREYYCTAEGKVRITIDRELRCADQRGRFLLSAQFPTPVPRALIIELKCAFEDYEHAGKLANRLPLSYDKCSKFVLASTPGIGVGAFL